MFGVVEDALEEADGVVPVLGGNVFVGGLDLVGGLAVGGQQHRIGTGWPGSESGGAEDLCGADAGDKRQHGEGDEKNEAR